MNCPLIRQFLRGRHIGLLVALVMTSASVTSAQVTVPGADGSDGVFAPTGNTVIDLSQAANASWNTGSPVPGKGVYDGAKWAVVFKYSSVNIPAGVTVTFLNHPSVAPVVWLVSGNVTIGGTLMLDGGAFVTPLASPLPGPGGYSGGLGELNNSVLAQSGFGPGGAGYGGSPASGGGYSTQGQSLNGQGGPVYGVNELVPLIGGSGGAGRVSFDRQLHAGGGGGGAILIAASGTITCNGLITAQGGAGALGGGGSGGAIRLVANVVTGSGALNALGGIETIGNYPVEGGYGRVRLEANSLTGSISILPPNFTQGSPGATATLWPSASTPTATILSVGGLTPPVDPHASLSPGAFDLLLSTVGPITVVVQTANVPTDATVSVHLTPQYGASVRTTASHTSGDATLSTWTAQFTPSPGPFTLQADVGP